MTQGTRLNRSRRALGIYIAVPLLALVSLFAWGLSSPVGSSPDDDFHLSSIWCGSGDNEAGCTSVEDSDKRSVSRDLVVDAVCYAFNDKASANCQGEDFGDNPDDVVTTDRGNFAGLYPPVYYFVMSAFAGADIETSVLVIKFVNSLLFVGFVSALFYLLPAHRRPTLVWALVVSLVPLGMFLIPSTNPSGWAILSAGTLWISLLGFFESTGRRRVALGAMSVVATVIGAGARADAAVYAGVAILVVVIMTAAWSRRYLLSAILPAALMIIALFFYFSSDQSAAAGTGLVAEEDKPNSVSLVVLAAANLLNVPSLWVGSFGYWGLGWLDTAMPAAVWVAIMGSFCGAVFLGLSARTRRKGLAAIVVLAALWLVPTAILVQSQAVVGYYVQPRYILPLAIMLVGIVLLQDPHSRIVVNRVQIGLGVVAISLANAVALHTNIRRYVTGTDEQGANLDAGAEWWWDIPVSPMATWIVGSLAFAGVLVLISTKLWNPPLTAFEHEAEPIAR